MSQDSVLKRKSFSFSVRIVRLCKYLSGQHREYILSRQLLRSGTAIGALIREAEFAESRKDFVHKLTIALKEANETEYWLQLIYATDYINKQMYDSIYEDIIELIRMLVSSIKTIKSKEGFSN
jgi:four helix bundle protein